MPHADKVGRGFDELHEALHLQGPLGDPKLQDGIHLAHIIGSALLLGDIGDEANHPDRPAVLVALRLTAEAEPAVLARLGAQADLQVVRRAVLEVGLDAVAHELQIFGMEQAMDGVPVIW